MCAMIIEKIKALAVARVEAARLETAIQRDLGKELAGLPAQFGFDDVNSFVRAVKAAASGTGSHQGSRPKPARRPRAKITPATRAAVKKLVAGGKTGAEVAKTVGISLPSVQNIKRALGLVRAKGKPAPRKTKTVHRPKSKPRARPTRPAAAAPAPVSSPPTPGT